MVKLKQEVGKERNNTEGTSSKPQNNPLCHYLECGTVFRWERSKKNYRNQVQKSVTAISF